MRDLGLDYKFFTYFIKTYPKESEKYDQYAQAAQRMVSSLNKRAMKATFRGTFNAITELLNFPLEFIKDYQELYVKTIQKVLAQAKSYRLYIEVLASIPMITTKESQEFFLPILQELAQKYPQFSPSMSPNHVINCLKHFTLRNFKSAQLYNAILSDIGKHFSSLYSEELLDILTSFRKVHIKHSDLFDKILLRMLDHDIMTYQFLREILFNFFILGHNTKQAKKFTSALIQTLNLGDFPYNIILLRYILILNMENEQELIEKILPYILKGNQKWSVPLELLHDFFRIVYKNHTEYAYAIETLMKESLDEKPNFGPIDNDMQKVKDYLIEFTLFRCSTA